MEIRDLISTDMGKICKIMTKIGVKQFNNCIDPKEIKGKDVEAVGITVLMNIAGIVISNYSNAEKDIIDFLSDLTGMKIEEITNLKLPEFADLVIAVVTKDDFKDFFSRVLKLFNQ